MQGLRQGRASAISARAAPGRPRLTASALARMKHLAAILLFTVLLVLARPATAEKIQVEYHRVDEETCLQPRDVEGDADS